MKANYKEETEIVLQWNDAQKYLEEDKLCWLNNEFLKACADDISFVTSNSDMVMANYSTPTSKIKVLVFIVLNNDEKILNLEDAIHLNYIIFIKSEKKKYGNVFLIMVMMA